ncbi:MAG: ClpXP protease specificity-enhancing factor SspB, partial [Polyangiales bacterium]
MAEEEKPLPPKLDVARYLLAQGSVFVHLDPRMDTVAVPQWYRSEPQLVLQIGFDMPVPIRDLEVDADGVYGTLSFNRTPFTCEVPWEAVFALAGDDGRGMVWPDSMPHEISEEIEREAGREPPPVVEERPSLRVLPAVEESESRPSSPPKPGERPSYLK